MSFIIMCSGVDGIRGVSCAGLAYWLVGGVRDAYALCNKKTAAVCVVCLCVYVHVVCVKRERAESGCACMDQYILSYHPTCRKD